MTINTSKVSAIVGSSRFEAEGPAEVVHSQYSQFLKSVKARSAPAADGPSTPGSWVWQRFVSVGVTSTAAATASPAVRFVTHFGPPCTTA